MSEKNGQSNGVSLSNFGRESRQYGDELVGHRLSAKLSVRPFEKVMRLDSIRYHSSLLSSERALSLDCVRDGWNDEDVLELKDLSIKLDEISVMEDDRFLDADIKALKSLYYPEKLTSGYINVAVWNDEVKTDLEIQAGWCGMTPCVYLQMRIMERYIREIDRNRKLHLACKDFGKSENTMREAVADFRSWLRRRVKKLSKIIEEFSESGS